MSTRFPRKCRRQSLIGTTHPHGQVENATAPSAGGSPDGNGEVRLRMRLPFRTTSSYAHKKEGANPTVRPRQNVQRSIPTTKSMAPCQLPSGCGIDRLLLALLLVGTTLRLNPSLWRRLFARRVSLFRLGSRGFLRAYLVFRRN